MKTFYISFLFIITCVAGFAQDTLFTKEGKAINCKILEVRSSQIKYHSPTDAEKQFSWIATSNVSSIHYQNGTYDVFENLADSSSFRSTVINGQTTPNQPADNNIENADQNSIYAREAARKAAVADAVFIGVRVVGFILRVALEIATAGNCHSSLDYHHGSGNHGTNRPRGH